MTKIILAFPCMGKTYYANQHPNIALDLDSSDFLFDKTGYKHLNSKKFKDVSNLKRKANGLENYLKTIDEAVKSNKYKYIFADQKPEIVKGIIAMGYDVHYVKPFPTVTSEKNLRSRAKLRGYDKEWIENTIKFLNPYVPSVFTLGPYPLTNFTLWELEHIYLYFTPPQDYLSDFLDKFE